MICFIYYISLCIYSFLINNTESNCYNERSDVSKELSGQWINDNTYAGNRYGRYSREFIDRKNATDLWWSEACPVQMTLFSCYRYDIDPLHGKGANAEFRKFNVSKCELDQYSPTMFLNRIRDRKILICCDSISMQFFIELICNLHGTTTMKYDAVWTNIPWIFGSQECKLSSGKHCHLVEAKVSFPEYNAHIQYLGTHITRIEGNRLHGRNTLQGYQRFGKLRNIKKDILLLNFGVHFHDSNEYRKLIHNLLIEYKSKKYVLPNIIWRETAPQHFDTPDGLYHKSSSLIHRSSCTPYKNYSYVYDHNIYNRVVDELFRKFKIDIPILRIYNSSKTEFDAHLEKQDRMDEKDRRDCTHFCQPSGVLNHWVELFYYALKFY